MIAFLIEAQVRPEKWNEFLTIIRNVKERLKENEHCDQLKVYVDMDNQFIFSINSFWKSSNGFVKFLRSDEFSMFLLAFKILRKNPEIRYFKKEEVGGIESLRQLRKLVK